MKRTLAAVAVVLALAAASVSPARGQLGASIVYDPRNHVENVLTAARTLETARRLAEQIERMDRNLRRLSDPRYRDLGGWLGELYGATDTGGLVWTMPEAPEGWAEVYHALAFSPEVIEVIDAAAHERLRAATSLASLRGILAAGTVHARDYEADLAWLAGLGALARGAGGNLEAHGVAATYRDFSAQELVRLNQQLGAILSAETAIGGWEISRAANAEATANWLLDEHAEDEFPDYDGEAGARGIPADWPYPCFGCTE